MNPPTNLLESLRHVVEKQIVIDIGKLILAKRAAGRPKDLVLVPELEAIQELQRLAQS